MKPENEIKIFGYADLEPPIPGSWKDEVFKTVEEAEGTIAEHHIVAMFAEAVDRMRRKQKEAFRNLRAILSHPTH